MICPGCNGSGESIYYVEIHRDENSVTVEQRKGICRTCNGSGEKPQTNADRIRAMTDEELAERLKNLYTEETEQGGGDIARLWCDGKAGCIDADGAIDCDDEKLTACILRWLQQPCGGADHE